MPYLLFAHLQQNEQNNFNILIDLILSFSRINGKLKHCKQFNAFDVDIHVATLIIINYWKAKKNFFSI